MYGVAKACGFQPLISRDTSLSSPNAIDVTQVFPFLQAPATSSAATSAAAGATYWSKFREHKAQTFDSRAFSLNYMKDIELVGLFQSWRYFDHVRADIRQQFSFSQSAIALVQQFLHEALAEARDVVWDDGTLFGEDLASFPVTFVGVHIRRQGYELEEWRRLGYKAVDVNYIYAAMHYYRHKFKNVIFIVTSDDLEWCRANIKPANTVVTYSKFTHQGLDMCLLTQGNHTIISTGAFGWWAAWLNGGTALYYKDHPVPRSEMAREFKAVDYYPDNWLPVMS